MQGPWWTGKLPAGGARSTVLWPALTPGSAWFEGSQSRAPPCASVTQHTSISPASREKPISYPKVFQKLQTPAFHTSFSPTWSRPLTAHRGEDKQPDLQLQVPDLHRRTALRHKCWPHGRPGSPDPTLRALTTSSSMSVYSLRLRVPD